MIAAIYARKSTDQHVADGEKFVTRQKARPRHLRRPRVLTPQRAIAWVRAVLILTVALAGCAPMTPEVRAAIEEQERRRAIECERRGGWYVTGSSCISRGGGA